MTGHYHDPLGTYDYCDDPRCPRAGLPSDRSEQPSQRAKGAVNTMRKYFRPAPDAGSKTPTVGGTDLDSLQGMIAHLAAKGWPDEQATQAANHYWLNARAGLTTQAGLEQCAARMFAHATNDGSNR